MNNNEKLELLKDSIYQLYSKEGRSKSYIARLFKINRKAVADKIRKWSFPESETMRHVSKSTEKAIRKHREKIISMLNKDYNIKDILEACDITETEFRAFNKQDSAINRAHDEWGIRKRNVHTGLIEGQINKSSRNYDIKHIEGEIWMPVMGYEWYEVSNMGRVRHYVKRYGAYYEVKPQINKYNGRCYIMLQKDGVRRNLQLARVVAQVFHPHPEEKNTVNHKNGNPLDNRADNLEWCTQSENNKHAYTALHREGVHGKRYDFDYILYKGKYEFKTVTAFARFIGKSETQARRYMDEPEKHEIRLMHNRID